jgi:hypothetical protein
VEFADLVPAAGREVSAAAGRVWNGVPVD